MKYYILKLRRWLSRLFYKKWPVRIQFANSTVTSNEVDPLKEIIDLRIYEIIQKK